MSGSLHSAIYCGEVMHQRLKPAEHRFVYKVSSWLLDLDELEALDTLRFFSVNRFNLFSFHTKDHGDGSTTPLKEQVNALLRDNNIDLGAGAIRILCYPRILGYVFNPLSVFYCYNEDKELAAILYEVSNTFNQRYSYLIPVEKASGNVIQQACSKHFYVSPFIPMETHYQFRMTPPNDSVAVLIHQTDPEGAILNATFTGQRIEITEKTITQTFWRHPLMTMKVIAGIHWEALQLWRKGMRIQPRPTPPKHRISLVQQTEMNSL